MKPEDKFILSKGHAAYALYAVLKRKGYPIGDISKLCHHPKRNLDMGIEATTGSLGHGLSIGVGMALAKKLRKEPGNIYVLLGDGECQEGAVWEAAQFASAHQLNNLVAIVDHNGYQALGRTLRSPSDLCNAFGCCETFAVEHDNIKTAPFGSLCDPHEELPYFAIVKTIKGHPVSFMRDNPLWHFRQLTPEEHAKAVEEVKNG
jgi:transketolase